jgi:hypothetical protein
MKKTDWLAAAEGVLQIQSIIRLVNDQICRRGIFKFLQLMESMQGFNALTKNKHEKFE